MSEIELLRKENAELKSYVERLRKFIKHLTMTQTIDDDCEHNAAMLWQESPSTSITEHDKQLRDEVIEECVMSIVGHDYSEEVQKAIRSLKDKP